MKILTLKFLLPLAVILFFAGAISQAIENPEFEEYERTYPKYVKSNKPLSVLNQKVSINRMNPSKKLGGIFSPNSPPGKPTFSCHFLQ